MGIFVIFEYPHLAKSTIQTTSLTTTLYTNHFENALLNCFYFDDGRLDRRGRGWSYSRSSSPPKNTTLTFALPAGKSQIVAFQDNTQTVWGEAQFRSEGSGFDYSAILSKNSNNYDMTISAKENSCVSSRTENFWLAEYTPIGDSDGSC